MKNILKFKKNEVNDVNKIEETKEEIVMKPKFSLKKKLAIGGGLLALVVGGAVALYNKGKKSINESDNDEEDKNEEDFNDNEVEDKDEVNEVTIED